MRLPRSLARETAQHAATAPDRFRALHAQLVAAIPEHERAIVGHAAILAYLTALGIQRPSGRPLCWRMVRRWHAEHDFPLLPGRMTLGRHRAQPVTTVYAVTAWIVTRPANHETALFSIPMANFRLPAIESGEAASENDCPIPMLPSRVDCRPSRLAT